MILTIIKLYIHLSMEEKSLIPHFTKQTVVSKPGIPQQRIQSALVLVAGPPVDLKVDEPRR